MIVFPAIDLKDGQCVRLLKGDMGEATVFNDDPAAQAQDFADAGATWLHMVDLNGAFAGRAVNAEAVSAVLKSTRLKVQLGGGIRTRHDIDRWISAGVSRVVMGTAALKNPALVQSAAKDLPGQIVVAVDARGGMVSVEGWAETSDMPVLDLAKRFEDAGVAALLFTDVDRDGALEGVNVEATAKLASQTSIPVIASGGVSGPEDIKALRAAETGSGSIDGVICGRSLYDGRLDLGEALALAS
ncbi:MAG: 1-(5-phosphoribosyl)-5-[(5-phosphoribosylamino)methylideneamino]imidazole-4-carboxamide isomerase [Sphingomonadales bacterium]